jgi:hypothetical protein
MLRVAMIRAGARLRHLAQALAMASAAAQDL